MPSEWAMKRAQVVEGTFNCTPSSKPLILAIAAEIDGARAQSRHEGLEEAAVITRDSLYAYQVRYRIRARLNQEPTS